MYLDIINKCRDNDQYKVVLLNEHPAKVTVMCLKPKEDIPKETHEGVQVLLLIQGTIRVDIMEQGSYILFPGDTISIPSNKVHYVINESRDTNAKLISFYALIKY